MSPAVYEQQQRLGDPKVFLRLDDMTRERADGMIADPPGISPLSC